MTNSPIRSTMTTCVSLLFATGLATLVFFDGWRGEQKLPQSPEHDYPFAAEVASKIPDDPELALRMATRWRDVARQVAQAEGADGLRTLDLFEADAADIFLSNPSSFHELVALVGTDNPIRELSVGPWREAVLQWSRAGKLGPYRDHLARLNSDQLKILTETPGCLPLLGRGAKQAESMLSRHGARAWRLFVVVDFAEEVAGVERVANALAFYGERMLRVNESHGPTLAFMFIPPKQDDSGHLPHLFNAAIDVLGIDDAGALFLANYDDLTRLVLAERRTPEDIIRAIHLLAGQPEEVRALAPDSVRVVRLLLEQQGSVPIGVQILGRCGPEAADLLFENGGYAGNPQEKAATLLILAHRGWPGLELMRTFRDEQSWHSLLRRDDLMDGEAEPLIVRLVGKLERSAERQNDIERYLSMPREQILELDIPPTNTDLLISFVPGYLVARTVINISRGYRVETSEIGEAGLDAVSSVTFFGKIAGQAIKTIGTGALKAEAKAATNEVVRQASRQFAAKESKQGAMTLLTRLPSAMVSLMKLLPQQLPKLNVTSVFRSASALAKKVNVRTWGKLDRRIIMRGDRKVVIDLFREEVYIIVRDEVRDEVRNKAIAIAFDKLKEAMEEAVAWRFASENVGEVSPCIMERIHPDMRLELDDSPPTQIPVPTSPAPDPVVPSTDLPNKLSDHPTYAAVGSALIIICLLFALPRVRTILARLVVPGLMTHTNKPRRYEE